MKRHLILWLLVSLLLVACGADTPKEATASSPSYASLQFSEPLPLEYAKEFSVTYSPEGYGDVSIGTDQRFLLVPEGAAVPSDIPERITVLQMPLDNLYLVSSSSMDYFRELSAIDRITLSGQKAEGWYIEEAKTAMESDALRYAGKYSTPDYELILASGCRLAIENTMIYHSPEVIEQLKNLGIPTLIERSSYESEPLARMEWLKLYAALLGKTDEANAYFDRLTAALSPVLSQSSTGKSVVFFSVTSAGAVTVRKPADYVSKAIRLGGGVPVAFETDDGSLSTLTVGLETFYAAAKDADVLIYNGTIVGEVETLPDLLQKCPLLADFKAVRSGDVWCAGKNLFQQPLGLGDFILDVHSILTEDAPENLRFLTRLS